jgi:5'-phosphate synthase pdxT subunit
MMKIGILALQGAFREHQKMLELLGAETQLVKLPQHLEGLDGLVVPGGESTTMGKLLREYDLQKPIQNLAKAGMPVFGTCAGMIVMANKIHGAAEPHLALMDVEVNRNSFGRQVDSFETDLEMPVIGEQPFPAVFIRAPHVESVGPEVTTLATYNGRVVAAEQGHYLALSFHPELTGDTRIHEHFLNMVKKRK